MKIFDGTNNLTKLSVIVCHNLSHEVILLYETLLYERILKPIANPRLNT